MSYNDLQRLTREVHAQSPQERLEMLLSYFDHQPTFISRGKYANNNPRNNVVWVRGFDEGSYHVKEWSFSKNGITTHGRNYYATLDVGGSPSPGATHLQLANPATQNAITFPAVLDDTWGVFDTPDGAAITGSITTFTSGYPTVSDPDPENTGAGAAVVTYQAAYGLGGGWSADPVTIKNGCIMGTASPTSVTPLICHFVTPTSGGVTKATNDTLKVTVNHPVGSS